MATAIDLGAELREIDRAIMHSERSAARLYGRMRDGVEGAAASYEAEVARTARLKAERTAIAGAAEIEQEDRQLAAQDQRERERVAARGRYHELLTGPAVASAERIDAALEALVSELAALRSIFEEARALRKPFVDAPDENRRFDDYQAIASDLNFAVVDDALEAALIRLSVLVGKTPSAGIAAEPLADTVRRRADYALKRAEREFGSSD